MKKRLKTKGRKVLDPFILNEESRKIEKSKGNAWGWLYEERSSPATFGRAKLIKGNNRRK